MTLTHKPIDTRSIMWHILNIAMKKYFSKISISFLILTFSLASTLCCHSFAATSSSVKTDRALPACHAHKNRSESPVKGTCDCCVSKQSSADSAVNFSLRVPQILLGYLSLNMLSSPFSPVKTKFNLAYLDGPPGHYSEIPLYLKSHAFRI